MQENDNETEEYNPTHETLSRARARALQAFRGKTVHDIVDEITLHALVDFEMTRRFGDEKMRFAAAREIVQTWTRMPPRPALPPEAGIVPGSDEWKQRCKDAEQDAAVRAFLVEQGWTAPKEKGSSN